MSIQHYVPYQSPLLTTTVASVIRAN